MSQELQATTNQVLMQEILVLKDMVLNQKANRLNDSLFSKELAPHYQQLAIQLSKSTMVPKAYQGKPQDLFVAMAMGYQVGLSVEQAVQCIAVINGRPSMWGDDMLALCMAHPDFEDIAETEMLREGEIIGFTCIIRRKDRSDTVRSFTLDMAKKAKLLGKAGPWQDYTTRMLQLRARGFALRDAFPDALKGIKSREEIEDYIEGEFRRSDDKPQSRTEILKQDIINKIGAKEDAKSVCDNINSLDSLESKEASSEAANLPDNAVGQVVENSVENLPSPDAPATSEQISMIKELIIEKGFSDERILKALFFYEIGKVDDLNYGQAVHFLNLLNR